MKIVPHNHRDVSGIRPARRSSHQLGTGLVNIVELSLSPIKIFNLLQIELHFSSLTLQVTVAKYLDFFLRRKEILRNLLLSC